MPHKHVSGDTTKQLPISIKIIFMLLTCYLFCISLSAFTLFIRLVKVRPTCTFRILLQQCCSMVYQHFLIFLALAEPGKPARYVY